MKKHQEIQLKRNIGIIAHVDAGKTTVSERILFYTGRIHQSGEVHDGRATMDWDDREKNHGITINSAATTVQWRKHYINLIDTPGHVDFGIEVKRALRVLDGAVVVFDAVAGVEPQSETNWRMAGEYGVARIAFVNKMDRPGADFHRVAGMIRERLGAVALPIQLPIMADDRWSGGIIDLVNMHMIHWLDERGKEIECLAIPDNWIDTARAARLRLVETALEQDDSLLGAYLAEGREPSRPQLLACLRAGVQSGAFVPILCGSALKNRGLQPLLDAVVDLLPNPLDGPAPDSVSDDSGLVAYAFKTVQKGGFGMQTWLRVYSGSLAVGDRVWNASRRKSERIGRLVRMNSSDEEKISSAVRGDIVAALGLKETVTGDTLCADSSREVILERIQIPEPVTRVSVEAANRCEREKLGLALNRMIREDPTLHVSVDAETGQSILSGMGELHLEMTKEKLEDVLGVGVQFGRPQVAYRETIRRVAQVLVRHRKQDGGPGQFADVEIRLEPMPRGAGFEFVSKITGGAIPREFIPGVEKGIRKAMCHGVIGGHPVVDVRAVLLDGANHEQDSSILAFEVAAVKAFREAVAQAQPVLLEPLMLVYVTTPMDYIGDIIGDLSRRRGLIQTQTGRGSVTEIAARVPLAELFGYIGDLRSLSSGRAEFTMEFDHYAAKAA